MRNRALLALVMVAAAIFVFGVAGLIVSGRQDPVSDFVAAPRGTPAPAGPQTLQLRPETSPEPSTASSPEGSPDETAAAYFQAWVKSDYDAMRELVDDPPDDFADQHREFEDAALSKSLRITVGNLVRTGDETAEIPFTQERDEQDAGTWRFDSSLQLAVRDLTWKVVWTPSVLHPEIQPGGSLVRTEPDAGPLRPVTRDGREFPQNSGAEAYLENLMNQGVAPTAGVAVGWALQIDNPGMPPKTVLSYKPEKRPVGVRTTIDYAVQAAAARALDGVQRAAIVAVRPSTGEVLAVADRLGGKGAFDLKYPPGSTFKTITAAALLNNGLSPDSTVDCPAVYQIPFNRSIHNYKDENHGPVTLRQAFALSCNTTFARLTIERLNGDTLVDQAKAFGFRAQGDSGDTWTCGSLQRPEKPDALAEDSFGQGTVEATPLCMALVAAAVESGEWRQARPLADEAPQGELRQSVPLPSNVAEGLRSLMSAVTVDGTAAGSELPQGVAGKTGTAEDGQGGQDHAWFIGYRGDLAFAVFVEHGGTGRGAAVPIAARFLKAL
ncbi:penicillin-binding transpeptidase domain-containing protein [Microbispora sp. KK1-11]|uniref:penicillin-binding transpeptidase domain-containing protein n=1 Tax=Microbispora sp. KK1-11 TaxID=2053005 RepID=UPI001158455F|nr:penicillin-binding transpeptidase domain-containing protein [Microbispora sp. KK1-11]TQS30513.1 cell division protein FtsI [Microbispora sp. KK1-11]